MFVFLRGQGWGFVVYVLLLNKEGIERGLSLKTFFLLYISIIKSHQCFIFILFVYSVIKELQAYHNQQLVEQEKLYKHRKKCYDDPHHYLGLIINGMDKKKILLPHFVCVPKNLKEENFIHFHLVGCMVFNGQMSPSVYFTTPNIHNDANLTITIIHHVLSHWPGDLPEVLYL